MTEDSGDGFGFTWGETEGILWLSNGDGEYKRIERSFFETLRTVAKDPVRRADLSTEENAAIDELIADGYLIDGAAVTRKPTPEDIRLAPRILAFLAGFAGLCLIVAVRFEAAVSFPTDPWVNVWALPYFLVVTLLHESGHYFVARRYMKPSIRLGLLNKVFPAVITTTNGAWRCPRSIRIWIALAGPFVHVFVVLAVGIVHLVVAPENSLLSTLLLVEVARIVFFLNPLLDGDGYWILVDYLNVVNLRSRGFRDLRTLRPTLPAAYAAAVVSFTVLGVAVGLYSFLRVFGPL